MRTSYCQISGRDICNFDEAASLTMNCKWLWTWDKRIIACENQSYTHTAALPHNQLLIGSEQQEKEVDMVSYIVPTVITYVVRIWHILWVWSICLKTDSSGLWTINGGKDNPQTRLLLQIQSNMTIRIQGLHGLKQLGGIGFMLVQPLSFVYQKVDYTIIM